MVQNIGQVSIESVNMGWLIRVGRIILRRRVSSIARFRRTVERKYGLEIGGPSGAFQDSGILPVYRYIARLDNVVFSASTVWAEDSGSSIICDATDLNSIPDGKYDFVLSCHNLEHIANPIKALYEWQRVLTDCGSLILIVPDYRYTVDHRRAPTTVAHMLQDYEQGIDEHDLTHIPEVLDLTDLSRDPATGTKDEFRARSLRNFENRCLHHHVFDTKNSRELLEAVGFSVQLVETVRPHHIVLLARLPRAK
jgi:SAM-dependent methyltransferase